MSIKKIDAICSTYMKLRELVKNDSELLANLNELRAFAMGENCPSCRDKALEKSDVCESCSGLNSQLSKIRVDRMNKMKTISRLRKQNEKLKGKIDFYEKKEVPNIVEVPEDIEIKIVEGWEENDFARALHVSAFSFPRF